MIATGDVVDFHWPQFNLVVEVDSWEYHRLRRPFEEDKRRGNRLELAHVMVLRYTDERPAQGARAGDRRAARGDGAPGPDGIGGEPTGYLGAPARRCLQRRR